MDMNTTDCGIDLGQYPGNFGTARISDTLGRLRPLQMLTRATLGSLIAGDQATGLQVARDDEKYLRHVLSHPITLAAYKEILENAKYIGVTQNFREIIDYFKTQETETPAGFRLEFVIAANALVQVNLVRDISYDKNGKRSIDDGIDADG